MAQFQEFKTFLYAFCGKRKVQPSYIVEEEDSGFYCEVRAPLGHKIIIRKAYTTFYAYSFCVYVIICIIL